MKTIIFGLEDSTDRWERCQEILKSEGIEASHHTVKINKNDMHRQSTKDFLCLLKQNRSEDLLFFEDDFELTDNWKEVLSKAWNDLPLNWDMLFLGANLTTAPQRITENLIRLKGSWMMHAVIISKKFIEYLVKNYDVNRHWVFDEWVRKTALNHRFYMTYPMISYQRKCYSDFAKKETDYKIFENPYYKKI